jgi:hypothetical protein
MPKTIVIQAGHKGSEKVSESHEFDTKSEALAKLAKGEAPAPFESIDHFFMCAVAHRTVEIQGEIRAKQDGAKPTAKKHGLLD